jgi:hypothetical protein
MATSLADKVLVRTRIKLRGAELAAYTPDLKMGDAKDGFCFEMPQRPVPEPRSPGVFDGTNVDLLWASVQTCIADKTGRDPPVFVETQKRTRSRAVEAAFVLGGACTVATFIACVVLLRRESENPGKTHFVVGQRVFRGLSDIKVMFSRVQINNGWDNPQINVKTSDGYSKLDRLVTTANDGYDPTTGVAPPPRDFAIHMGLVAGSGVDNIIIDTTIDQFRLCARDKTSFESDVGWITTEHGARVWVADRLPSGMTECNEAGSQYVADFSDNFGDGISRGLFCFSLAEFIKSGAGRAASSFLNDEHGNKDMFRWGIFQ